MTDPNTGVTFACRTRPMQLPKIPTDGDMYYDTAAVRAGEAAAASRHLEALTGVPALNNKRQCHKEFKREWVDALEGLQIPTSILNQQVEAAQAATAAREVYFTNRETPAGFLEGGPPAGYIGENYMLRLHMDTQTLNDYDGGGTSILPNRYQIPDISLLVPNAQSSTDFGGPLAPLVRVLREDKADTRPRPVPDALQDWGTGGGVGAGLPAPVSSSVRTANRLADAAIHRQPNTSTEYAGGLEGWGLAPSFSASGSTKHRLMQEPVTVGPTFTALQEYGGPGYTQSLAGTVDSRGRGLQGNNYARQPTALGGAGEENPGGAAYTLPPSQFALRTGQGTDGAGEGTRVTAGSLYGFGRDPHGIGGALAASVITPLRSGAIVDDPGRHMRMNPGMVTDNANGTAPQAPPVSGGVRVMPLETTVGVLRHGAPDVPGQDDGRGNSATNLTGAIATRASRTPQDNGFSQQRPGRLAVDDANGLGAALNLDTQSVAGPSARRSGGLMGREPPRATMAATAFEDIAARALDPAAQTSVAALSRGLGTAPAFRANADVNAAITTPATLPGIIPGPARGTVMQTAIGRSNPQWEGPSCNLWLGPVVDGDRGDRSIMDQDVRLSNTSLLQELVRGRYADPVIGPELARAPDIVLPPTRAQTLNAQANVASQARACGDAAYLNTALAREAEYMQIRRAHSKNAQLLNVCVDGYETDGN
jgi:hypothetical protein